VSRPPLTRAAIDEIRQLESGAEFGPWIVNTDKTGIGANWQIADFGYDDAAPDGVQLTTDGLRVSECRSAGALNEAKFCAAIRNNAVALLDAAAWAIEHGYGGDESQLLLIQPSFTVIEQLRTHANGYCGDGATPQCFGAMRDLIDQLTAEVSR